MRILLLIITVMGTLSGCAGAGTGGGDVSTIGHNVAALFPSSADWYWRYDREDSEEVAYWINQGLTNPFGEEWTTYRLWIGDDFDIVNGNVAWDLELYFADRGDWYFMGWAANPNGLSQDMGTTIFSGDGVTFATGSTVEGQQWTNDAAGFRWTTTAVERLETIEVNGLDYAGVWHIRLASDANNTPFEGDWYLVSGSFPLLAVKGWPEADWELVHNASTEELLWDFE